jgi:hypothetical protein
LTPPGCPAHRRFAHVRRRWPALPPGEEHGKPDACPYSNR